VIGSSERGAAARPLLSRVALALLLSATLLSATALFGGAAAAAAQETSVVSSGPSGGQPVNDAVAVNTHDGKSVFKLAFSVRHLSDSTVAPANVAVAYASCTSCRTVAIAIQIVFADSAPTVTPTNVALAINQDCNFCETFAAAYQYVFVDGADVTLSDEGRRRLKDIRQALKDLGKREDLTIQQLVAEVGTLTAQIGDVLEHELVVRDGGTNGSTTSSTDTSTSTTSGPGSSDTSPTTSTAPSSTTSSTITESSSSTSTSAPTSTTAP
jgi:putative peptide zinc metalloprotease protein